MDGDGHPEREDPERTVTIPLTTTDQDGASSADYSGVPANVIFVPGDTEQTFTFTADEDTTTTTARA